MNLGDTIQHVLPYLEYKQRGRMLLVSRGWAAGMTTTAPHMIAFAIEKSSAVTVSYCQELRASGIFFITHVRLSTTTTDEELGLLVQAMGA